MTKMDRKNDLLSDPVVRFLLGVGGAAAAGIAAKLLYNRCSRAEKKEWRESLHHHGEVGVPILIGGILSGSPVATGFGLGLMLSDLDDKDEWFSRKK